MLYVNGVSTLLSREQGPKSSLGVNNPVLFVVEKKCSKTAFGMGLGLLRIAYDGLANLRVSSECGKKREERHLGPLTGLPMA